MEEKTRAKKKPRLAIKDEMQTSIRDRHSTDTFALTQEHIDFLRQARVVWDPSENGAPIIDPEVLSESGLRRVNAALQVVLKHGDLKPGMYTISNQLKARYDYDEIRADAARNMIAIPAPEEVTFELRPEHIKLLKNANADAFLYFGACGFNSRHPYGNMNYWEIEAAHILGMPVYRDQNGSPSFTESELEHLLGLHHDMLIALPVFLAHCLISAGEFERKPGGNNWVRLSWQ